VLPGAFPAYLERALGLVAAEAPVHFAAARDHLGALALVIRVAGSPPLRLFLGTGPPWTAPGSDGDVEAALAPGDLAALLAGELTIEEAVGCDRLSIRGELDRVLPFLDALGAWLHGALRSPSLPHLHRQYLAADDKGAWP
jgi:hypothetical protein